MAARRGGNTLTRAAARPSTSQLITGCRGTSQPMQLIHGVQHREQPTTAMAAHHSGDGRRGLRHIYWSMMCPGGMSQDNATQYGLPHIAVYDPRGLRSLTADGSAQCRTRHEHIAGTHRGCHSALQLRIATGGRHNAAITEAHCSMTHRSAAQQEASSHSKERRPHGGAAWECAAYFVLDVA